jgi:hypothetical protein
LAEPMNLLNPKKLLLTKLTAVKPLAKQKYFLGSREIQPDLPTDPIELVEIEAVFSNAFQVIAWRELQDDSVLRQDWVLVRPLQGACALINTALTSDNAKFFKLRTQPL